MPIASPPGQCCNAIHVFPLRSAAGRAAFPGRVVRLKRRSVVVSKDPMSVERSTFVLFASLFLVLLYWQWQPMTGTVWSVAEPVWRMVLWVIFAIGWGIVLLSTFMIGHFDLFGLNQVFLNWRRQEPPAPEFKEPGFYKFVRHPIMVGFIIAFWATPDMTTGHALFAAVITIYVLIAIRLEERDLIAMLGEAYTSYRERVPALVPFTKRGRGAGKSSGDTSGAGE